MSRIVFDVLDIFPAVLLESVQSHCLPVYGQSLSLLDVSESRHLEWEQIECSAHAQVLLFVQLFWLASLLVVLERVEVVQKLAVEATNNHDFIWADLAHSCALSRSDQRGSLNLLNIDSLPLVFEWVVDVVVVALNRGRVLFVRILNAAEHIYEFMVEVAARVVVPSFVDAWQLEPLINLNVVNLYSARSLVHFFPGARYDDVAIHNGAARVAMSCEIHPLFIEELQVVGA